MHFWSPNCVWGGFPCRRNVLIDQQLMLFLFESLSVVERTHGRASLKGQISDVKTNDADSVRGRLPSDRRHRGSQIIKCESTRVRRYERQPDNNASCSARQSTHESQINRNTERIFRYSEQKLVPKGKQDPKRTAMVQYIF